MSDSSDDMEQLCAMYEGYIESKICKYCNDNLCMYDDFPEHNICNECLYIEDKIHENTFKMINKKN